MDTDAFPNIDRKAVACFDVTQIPSHRHTRNSLFKGLRLDYAMKKAEVVVNPRLDSPDLKH